MKRDSQSSAIDAALALYGCAVIAFMVLPILVVIPMSFNDAAAFEIIPSNPSLTQYARLFGSEQWMTVLWRSVRIAATVMVFAGAIGTIAALGITLASRRVQPLLEAIFLAPQIVPSIVIAAAAYYIFVFLGLVGSSLGIVIMHTLLALPFVVVMVRGRLQGISPDLAHASASLGAGPFRTFLHVTLPQLRIALVGASVLAFHVSFDEVVLALFLSGARNKTLPVQLWETILFEVSPILPAISVVVLTLPILIVAPVIWMQRRAAATPPTMESR
jgi:ABC-type spermidine/putrescine transport system permease subunit II